MEWLGNLASFGALGHYKRECAANQAEATGAHRDIGRLCKSLEETEAKLKAAESQLFEADSRADHFKAENESLQAEVIRLREQLQDSQTRNQVLEEGAEAAAVRASDRIERLERVNATVTKERQRGWVELSQERSTSSRFQWLIKTLMQQAINRQGYIENLLAEQGELQRRVDELAPFRARYLRWRRTWRGRKRDESGRFLPSCQAETPAQETA